MTGQKITAQDGSGHTDVFDVVAWAPAAESANIVHPLLDGSIVVKIVGDRLRTGELQLIFVSDAGADFARALLGRPTWFVLEYPDRPTAEMSFVRQGSMSTVIHDEARMLWEFSVGFQEIVAP